MKKLVCAVAAIALPLQAGADCFSKKEWQAVNVQVMERSLQDAALQCTNVKDHNHDPAYNSFVKLMAQPLYVNGKIFRAHFVRAYGRSSGNQIDEFVTRVANIASSRSMASMKFCADTDAWFNEALAISPIQLTTTAIAFNTEHVGEMSAFGKECAAAEVVHKKHHRAAVIETAKHSHKSLKKVASAE